MEDVKEYSYDSRRATLAQTLAALALHTLNMGVGMVVSTPVYIIGALRESSSGLHFTEEQASWFGGIMFVVQPLGSLVSGMIQETVSRRTALIAVNLPLIVAWVIMYYATNIAALFFGIVLIGLSIGFMEAPVLAYIGEIAEPRLRGILSSLGGIVFNMGGLMTTFVGARASWRSIVLFNTIGPLVSLLAMAMVPDSPPWLASKGRVPDAQKAYQWLRGWTTPKAVLDELNNMVAYVQERKPPPTNEENGQGKTEVNKKQESALETFLQPAIQRPLRMIILYFITSVCVTLCGMRPFFKEELKTISLPITIDNFLIWSSVFTFLGSLSASFSLRTLGKRGLTFISLALSIFSSLGFGVYVALGVEWPFIPLLLLLLSSYAATLGVVFVPWVLISEVFPLKGRGMASGVAAAMFYVVMSIAIKTYYNLTAVLGMSGTCILYGGVGVVGFVYLYHYMPETEGVAMVDIEAMFANKPASTPKEATPDEKKNTNSIGT